MPKQRERPIRSLIKGCSSLSDELDKKIEEVKKSSSDISSLMASILVSMDLCDFKKKSISNIVSIENKNRDYANINKKLLEENSILRDRISDLEMKINAMELKNKGK